MSHFVVMVAVPGDTPETEIETAVEKQLAPFHEYECTGIDDEYVVDVDVTDEARADYAKYGDGESFRDFCLGWYGSAKFEGEGDDIRVFRRTNPNAKWDWWVIGGRWSGLFNPEGSQGNPNAPAFAQRLPNTGNIIRKKDWPYEERMAKARDEWGQRYDAVWAVIGTLADDYQTFEQLTESMGQAGPMTREEAIADFHARGDNMLNPGAEPSEDDIARMMERGDPWRLVRKAYAEQPLVIAARNVDDPLATDEQRADQFDKGKLLSFFDSVDDYLVDRDKFLDLKAFASVGAYATVDLKGNWIQRGEMGWFGMDSDHDPDWPKPALDALEAFPDDTFLVAVDCHI